MTEITAKTPWAGHTGDVPLHLDYFDGSMFEALELVAKRYPRNIAFDCLPTTMVRSYWELGDILHFDPDTARRNVELGYYDTLRAFGRVRGCAYAVDNGPDSSADAAAFRARFDAVQKAVREKYPVTLTADAALLLARMKDAELAPLETVAEDVGVDPTVYYTTRTLGQAFLEHCDPARMASFAPLFAGSADAGRAALAALLPNTFLQALVWQALTAPELPEVTEHEDL